MLVRRVPLVSASLLLALALAGCDSGTDAGSGAVSGPSVIAPGKPGEANRTLSAQDAAEQRADDDTPNSADVTYTRKMIEHHAQALEMTALVPDRAASGDVKRLALRISAAQGPEIKAMEGWLTTHGRKTTGGGHTHTAMPGMATAAQLTALRAARGKAFDTLFLTLMITHHEGALTMAADVKAQGNNERVEEMADDVIAQQTSEITRMNGMR
ncbi:DUF305 domain-containing protein [Streptomyces sp. ID05-04B]|uniref:DUF305 domain-containing protein n=1 Tax=unclassified Streptomyces TaxID=2593676 RepID=UPI000D1998FE|nr:MULTISPECIES: DUF305 domain-containing protein [unclassified Streptomyces]AVV46251.1 DUF305 domain-containing protein [Streptomyces sp. P3]MDX5567197.1 DUF305 domain-containing protein [Streptomyces sp. ID05-04B]